MANAGYRDGVGDRGQHDVEGGAMRGKAGDAPVSNAAEAGIDPTSGVDLLQIIKTAESINEQFLAAVQRSAWQQSIRAYRNQHLVGSKYTSPPYRNRSKIFRPKIRTAIRKNLAAAATAMFSTSDVVQIKAEFDSNPVKQASAAVLHQIVNYRLDRTATKSGIPWFLMAMSANLDAQLQGVCVSKQYWDYEVSVEEHDVEEDVPIEEPAIAPNGGPMFNLDGTQMMTTRIERKSRIERTEHVIRDRPMVMTIPPEHVMVDPGAPWFDPTQLSTYLVVKFPMSIEDAMTMLANPGKPGRSQTEWLPLTRTELEQCASDMTSKSVRIERSGGVDRMETQKNAGTDNQIVWLYECFVRVGGADFTFWTAGNRFYASKVRTTREAYPEQFGARPYVYGYGMIESHNLAPMSAAESIMPLQVEANDTVNLRLDAMKQSLSPIAVVRQGTVFDWKQLHHRGAADSTVVVKNVDDLRFETTPPPNASAYQEMNLLNVDMDELTGSFAGSSVQANRQLNETVGGMRLLSGSANSVTEYDLRVWVETWAEPALRQAVRCVQWYEDDEHVFAIAGQRSKMLERYGVNEITDADLESEVSVSINVGIGSADPMQKLAKFGMAMETIAKAAPFMDKKPVLNGEEFIKEVMGDAGYNDGMRFFSFQEAGGAPSPEQIEAQMQMQLEQMRGQLEMALADKKNQGALENTALKGRLDLIKSIIDKIGEADAREQEMQVRREEANVARASGAASSLADLFKARLASDDRRRGIDVSAAVSREKANSRPPARQ